MTANSTVERAVSDTAIVQIVTAMLAALMTYLLARLNAKAADSVTKADETLGIVKVIRTQTNSQLGLALEAVARLRWDKAESSKDPSHLAEAREAQAKLDDHRRQEAEVNAKRPGGLLP